MWGVEESEHIERVNTYRCNIYRGWTVWKIGMPYECVVNMMNRCVVRRAPSCNQTNVCRRLYCFVCMIPSREKSALTGDWWCSSHFNIGKTLYYLFWLNVGSKPPVNIGKSRMSCERAVNVRNCCVVRRQPTCYQTNVCRDVCIAFACMIPSREKSISTGVVFGKHRRKSSAKKNRKVPRSDHW